MKKAFGSLIEIYATYDLLEAAQIKAILDEKGITATIRDLGISPYPLTIGTFNEKRILVRELDKDEACNTISRAVEDRIISSSGLFIKDKKG